MKNIIYCLIFTILAFGCSDDDKLPQVTPEEKGTVIDTDGNEYVWVRYNGLDWLASNFKGGVPYFENVYVHRLDEEQAAEDLKVYGNLYTYEEALANVEMLPEGWRLPTDEDWQKLEQAMGMSSKVAESKGWRGAPVGELLAQDETGSGMNLLLGGRCGARAGRPYYTELYQMREYGYYWSATCDDSSIPLVYYRSIRYNTSQIEREMMASIEKDYQDEMYTVYMSVRYVRDAQ